MAGRDFLSDDNESPSSPKMEGISPRDFLAEPEKESLGTSLAMAIPRVGEDIIKGGYNFIRNIPDYYRSAQSSIPAALDTIQQHPMNALKQGTAGLAEFGQNVFNMPHDIANYATNRLNLIPQDVNQKIQMGRMPDSENAINQQFGAPQTPGEEALRWAGKNADTLLGGFGALKTLNPLQLTNKGIAKKVVNELNNQVDKHSNMYDKLWDSADKKGFNQVPFDANALNSDMNIIQKYYPEKSYKTVNNLLETPTLENAQKAQSDLGQLRRALEEKSKTTPLLGEEKKIYDSISSAEKNIEGSMFKNAEGDLHNGLANKYKKITKSYAKNVVPYKYNSDIQDYLSKDITAKQLVQRLNQGPFAAKKGGFLTHPQFGIRNALLPVAGGLGVIGGGKYLLDQGLGTGNVSQSQ